jgi:hypothetical protein
VASDKLELVGAVHVHTRLSDGTGTPEELVAAAEELGLDFVVTADHDTLGLRESGAEGWHGRVLLAAASEVSTRRNLTHLVMLNHASVAGRCELTVPEALERARAEGGAALLAHANGRGLGGRGRDRRDWPWWDHPLLAGCEIWSYMQDWGHSFRILSPGSYRLESVAGRIAGPPDWLLAHWDEQAERRPFAGLGASDNHAKRLWPFRRRYWPHREIIGRLVNRVRLDAPLPADGRQAARQLMAALLAGRCLFAREELAASQGFDFRAEISPTGPTRQTGQTGPTTLRPGDTAPLAPGTRLVVESPVEAELRICRLGRAVASAAGRRLEFAPAEPGAWRAEARLGGKAWCFSNHVRLGLTVYR